MSRSSRCSGSRLTTDLHQRRPIAARHRRGPERPSARIRTHNRFPCVRLGAGPRKGLKPETPRRNGADKRFAPRCALAGDLLLPCAAKVGKSAFWNRAAVFNGFVQGLVAPGSRNAVVLGLQVHGLRGRGSHRARQGVLSCPGSVGCVQRSETHHERNPDRCVTPLALRHPTRRPCTPFPASKAPRSTGVDRKRRAACLSAASSARPVGSEHRRASGAQHRTPSPARAVLPTFDATKVGRQSPRQRAAKSQLKLKLTFNRSANRNNNHDRCVAPAAPRHPTLEVAAAPPASKAPRSAGRAGARPSIHRIGKPGLLRTAASGPARSPAWPCGTVP